MGHVPCPNPVKYTTLNRTRSTWRRSPCNQFTDSSTEAHVTHCQEGSRDNRIGPEASVLIAVTPCRWCLRVRAVVNQQVGKADKHIQLSDMISKDEAQPLASAEASDTVHGGSSSSSCSMSAAKSSTSFVPDSSNNSSPHQGPPEARSQAARATGYGTVAGSDMEKGLIDKPLVQRNSNDGANGEDHEAEGAVEKDQPGFLNQCKNSTFLGFRSVAQEHDTNPLLYYRIDICICTPSSYRSTAL